MDLESLASLYSPAGSLISVYLDKGPGVSARLTDLLKPVKEAAEMGRRDQMLSVRTDVERITELGPKMLNDGAKGFAVFASSADGIFGAFPLAISTGDGANIGRHPYLRPLRVASPPLHGVAVVAERRESRIYELVDRELSEPMVVTSDPGKRDYGGFRGVDEKHARAHADEEVGHMLRTVADWLFRRHQEAPFDFLALGGHQQMLEMLTPHLHAYLADIPRHTFIADPHTLTGPEVFHHVSEAGAMVRRAHDEQVIAKVLEAPHRGEPVAMGTAPVLTAVNLKAVDHLVISGHFVKAGVECTGCHWLGRAAEACPACGHAVTVVDDVLGRAIEVTLDAGGIVDQVEVASPLDSVGVGAVLRFSI